MSIPHTHFFGGGYQGRPGRNKVTNEPSRYEEMQIGETDSFFAHWSNVEWIVAGILSAGAAVTVFVWRLSVKVALLEHMVQKNDEDTQRRHEENIHLARGMQMRFDALAHRIDRTFYGQRDVG